MLFLLVDNHGTPLGEFDDRASALAAAQELVDVDPRAACECGVISFDEDGNRLDAPASGPAAA